MRLRAFTLTALALTHCSSDRQTSEQAWTPVASTDLGPVVAKVGTVPIYAKQIEAEARKSELSPRDALDRLIENNLLAEVARSRGVLLPSSADHEVGSAMVQRLLERELEPNLRPEVVPDADLQPLYEKLKDRFVHPRLVEIGFLAVYTGAPMQKEDREPREQTARELARYLKSHPAKTLEEFSNLARDTTWSSRHVVFRRIFQSPDKPLSPAVGKEVSQLRAPGDTTPLVVDEDGGFIARYISERPPENITLKQARGELLPPFFEQWRRQQFLDFTSKRAALHHVETYPDRLSRNDQGP